jgi:hypothetical protein
MEYGLIVSSNRIEIFLGDLFNTWFSWGGFYNISVFRGEHWESKKKEGNNCKPKRKSL